MSENTALGAVTEKEAKIIFISEAHEKFYYEKLKEVRYQDVYHKALCYFLGISDDIKRNIKDIYNFKTEYVKTEYLYNGCHSYHRMPLPSDYIKRKILLIIVKEFLFKELA